MKQHEHTVPSCIAFEQQKYRRYYMQDPQPIHSEMRNNSLQAQV